MLTTALAGCPSDGPYSISGSAVLPNCTETPERDLSGLWFDEGTLTITSEGCEGSDAPLGSVFDSCPLSWELSQDGNSIEILIDGEYALQGRICGDTLHLQGGWWLPLRNELDQCDYDDDDGAEVGIEMGGSSLSLQNESGPDQFLAGTLVLREECTGEYVMQLRPI